MKLGLSLVLAALVVGCVPVVDSECPGEVVCGNGCMPTGAVCCGDGYCSGGLECGPAGACLTPAEQTAAGCLEMGQQPCANEDGTIDCAPLSATCCGDHRNCPAGTACLNGGASCS
jgi:hypothetical protein